MRLTMKNWMLGTALIAGLLGTGAATAFAAPQDFHGQGGRGQGRDFGREPGRESGREFARGNDRGFNRGFERPEVRGYAGAGYGYGYGAPVVETYIPPCPGDGYVWLNGAWVFRGGPGFVRGYGYGRDVRGFDRGQGFDRGFDRGGRGFDRGARGRR